MLGASNLRQQRRLWTVLGRPDMIKTTNDERDADHEREIAVLEEIMLTRTADEWEEFLQARHVPAARVRTMGEAIADPQIASRGIIHRHGRAPEWTAASACRLPPSRSRMAGRASTRRRRRSASTTRRFSRSSSAAGIERGTFRPGDRVDTRVTIDRILEIVCVTCCEDRSITLTVLSPSPAQTS